MEGADRSSGEQTGSQRKRCRRRPGELEQSDKPNGKGGICVFFCSGFLPLSLYPFRMLCLQPFDIAVLHVCVSIVSQLRLTETLSVKRCKKKHL